MSFLFVTLLNICKPFPPHKDPARNMGGTLFGASEGVDFYVDRFGHLLDF